MADQTNTIPKGWKMTTLGEVADVNPTESLRRGELAKYVAMESLQPFTRRVSKYEIKEFAGGMKFRNGDTLLARITPCLENGKTSFVDILNDDEIGFGSTEYIVFREKISLSDKKFLYYLATSPRFRELAIKAMTGTSGRQRIQTDQLINELLLLPGHEEQRAIAAVLSSLDDKIELLREQNKTSEATAQAIFKEWFVNFNFPGATGKMIDSELGKIPEGWRIGKLGEVTNIVYGKNLPTENLKNVGYPVFGANGQVGFYDKFLYENQQVLVSCRGEASGQVNISLPNSFVTNNSLVLEIPKNSNLNFSFLKGFSLNTDYRIYVSGSAQPQITIETIKHCPILIPDNKTLVEFDNLSQPINKKVLSNFSQIQTLSILRDTLLPKLMKGEMRIKI